METEHGKRLDSKNPNKRNSNYQSAGANRINNQHQKQSSSDHTFAVTPHPEAAFMRPHIDIVRACVKGAIFVKRMPELLPHPSRVDTTSKEAQERYDMYTAGAEYDNFPLTTLLSMLGKMKIDDVSFNLPDGIKYLEEDADGDGISLRGMIDQCARNVIQMKWHVLLADYRGMSDLGLEQTSMRSLLPEDGANNNCTDSASECENVDFDPYVDLSESELEDLGLRASIKQYRRENVIDWHFARINGRMRLDYLILKEEGEEFAPASVGRTQIDSYLLLGIDDIGYYQAKIVNVVEGEYQTGEKNYPKVKGEYLQFIPAEIVCDEEFKSGAMPQELGYLSLLTDLALSRYRVSAAYKEAIENLLPTVNIFGINAAEWETFKEVNGRDYIASGSRTPNIWSNESASMEIMESNQSLKQFEDYFERNEKKVRALGGVFDTDKSGMRTATEVINEAEGQSAILTPTVSSIEAGMRRMVLYCGMFEGIFAPDKLEDNMDKIGLTLPREFAVRKLSVEEVKELREHYLAGLLPKDELFKVLEIGGWTQSSAEDLLKMADSGSDMPQPTPAGNQTNSDQTAPPESAEAQ
ncbi:putative portal protein [Vibrio phage 137E35-1]|nr:putative portal protein [Vibrio phage 137E35-1]CAH9015410.1 putative portal protein [Vibrio phage 230E39-1]